MQAHLAGDATWVPGFPADGQSFPCPAGQIIAGELVGTGDVDDIEWVQGSGIGPTITF